MNDTDQESNRPLTQIAEADDLWARVHTALNWDVAAAAGRSSARLEARLAARAKTLRGRATSSTPSESSIEFLAFHNGRERYGIELDEVIEIMALEHFSPVPRVPTYIDGVIQWRGSVLALMNVSKLFAVPQPGISDYHACVIVEAGGRRIAVMAGEVEEILSVPQSQIRPVPELPGDRPADWVRGVHDGNRMLLRLDQILQDERFIDTKSTTP